VICEENLTPLPNTWEWDHAQNVCLKIQDGTHFSPKDQRKQGTFKYVTAKNIRPWGMDLADITYLNEQDHRAIYQRCDPKKGDVLLVKDGVNTGDAALNTLDEEFSLLSSVCMLRPDSRVIEGAFLRYYLQSPIGYRSLTGQMSGTAIKRIVLHRIRDLPVPIAPLPEQRRIVAEIETQFTRLDAAVAALERAKANLKRYRTAVLAAAMLGVLPQGVCPEEAQVGWECFTIGEMAVDVRYGTSAKTNDDSSGVPVLRMGNVQNGRLAFSNLKYLPAEHPEFPELLLNPGDLLFNRTNSAELVGKSAVYQGPPAAYSYASYLLRVRLKAGYSPEFIAYFLNSTYGKRWVKSVVNQQVGQANVNGTKLKNLAIRMPPIEQQHGIVAEVERRLSVVEVQEANISANLKRANRLRQAILRKAFVGQLVPQDPNDEPAAVLLERIRADQANRASIRSSPRKKLRPAQPLLL
jgi:restriction endonuclease S subunit